MTHKKRLLSEFINLLVREVLTEQEFDWSRFSSSAETETDPVMQALTGMQADPAGQAAIAASKQAKAQSHQDILTVNKPLLAKKGINVDALKRLGEGAGGVAYAINDNTVLKVTGDAAEARVSNLIKGKNIRGVINIHDVWKFPNSNFYGIIMEKIIPFESWPNDQLKKDIEEVVDTFNLKQLLQKYKGNWEQIWNDISKSPMFSMAGDPKLLRKAFDTIATIGNSLQSAGIHNFFDLHVGNLGKRQNGEIIVFDIGFSGGGSEPPVLGAN